MIFLECISLRETLMAKRTELRQRERRIQENSEIAETEKNRSKQFQAQIESLQNKLRLEQVKKIGFVNKKLPVRSGFLTCKHG